LKAAAVQLGGAAVPNPACEEETTIETFKKRQKEMRRLERRQDKAAKRKEIKARKAAGITTESGPDTEAIEDAEGLTLQT
jgi:hypothetical protein